jgi:hypothetical protein
MAKRNQKAEEERLNESLIRVVKKAKKAKQASKKTVMEAAEAPTKAVPK